MRNENAEMSTVAPVTSRARRLAIVSALVTIGVAVAAGFLTAWFSTSVVNSGFGWIIGLLVTGVIPVFAAISVCSMLVARRLTTAGHSWFVGCFAVVGTISGALAVTAWGVGFSEADAGTPQSAFARALPVFALMALVAWAVACIAVARVLLLRTRLSFALRWLVSLLGGFLAGMIVGTTLLVPYTGVAVAIVALVTSSGTVAARNASPQATATAQLATSTPRHFPRALFSALTLLSTAIGVFGLVVAFTGNMWLGVDGTRAIGLGLQVLFVSAVPLVLAIGVIREARGRTSRWQVWAPILLVVIAVGLLATAYAFGPDWAEMEPWMRGSSVVGGVALAWWLVSTIRLVRGITWIIAIAAGALFAAVLGMMLLIVFAFLVPVAAPILFIVVVRRARAL